MSMGPANPRNIPNYLTASTPQGLRRLMLLNNIKQSSFINYFNIQFVNGKWVAWFYDELNNDQESKKLLQVKA